MKRLVLLMIAFGTILLVGCNGKTMYDTSEDRRSSYMDEFNEVYSDGPLMMVEFNAARGVPLGYDILIDRETGIRYIYGHNGGICPLIDDAYLKYVGSIPTTNN